MGWAEQGLRPPSRGLAPIFREQLAAHRSDSSNSCLLPNPGLEGKEGFSPSSCLPATHFPFSIHTLVCRRLHTPTLTHDVLQWLSAAQPKIPCRGSPQQPTDTSNSTHSWSPKRAHHHPGISYFDSTPGVRSPLPPDPITQPGCSLPWARPWVLITTQHRGHLHCTCKAEVQTVLPLSATQSGLGTALGL